MNLGDPQLELIDPTPNVHALFVNFDRLFFSTTLSNRVVVRWSKRMYSCAGICSYERGSGFCDVALSEPLLKLRPRKDLVETLLHEMIHAYLFVTNNDRDRDGHGPNFKQHMSRINRCAGLNITIYHDFHDEVKLYQTHVWRCNGPCQLKRPYFGIVRRTTNRAPGPSDYWWRDHKARCRGTFIKIKEPDIPVKKNVAPKTNVITNYIPSNKIKNNVPQKNTKPILTDCNCNNKANKNKKGWIIDNGNHSPKIYHKPVVNLKDQIIGGNRHRSNSADVVQTLRNVWGNKQFSNTKEVVMTSSPDLNPNKHKLELHHLENTPAKIKKIDDYFKATASEVLKDVYGKDIKLAQSNDGKKLVAINDVNLVPCPVCSIIVKKHAINTHLDECLNKDVIRKLTKDNVDRYNNMNPSQINERARLKEIVGPIPTIPKFEEINNFKIDNDDIKIELPDSLDTSLVNELFNKQPIIRTNTCATTRLSKPIKAGTFKSLVKTLAYNETPDKSKSVHRATAGPSNPIKTGDFQSLVKKLVYNDPADNSKSDNLVRAKASALNIVNADQSPYGRGKLLRSDVTDTKKSDNFVTAKVDMINIENIKVKTEPGTSKHIIKDVEHLCLCCSRKIEKPLEEHLEECTVLLTFVKEPMTVKEKFDAIANEAIIIDDDDDVFDESLTLNSTGTKTPCPCCLKMFEQADMNDHLDACLK